MKALIKVGYGCNEHCTFCHTQDVRHIDGTAAEVDTKIRRAAELGHTMVVLSGGEATIRPELLGWADLTASLGMDFGLVTNGLMLAYPEVLDRLLERRLRYVYMSLHGGEARVHNSLVRRTSFEAATTALRAVAGRGLDVTANCVVTRQNIRHLDALVDHVVALEGVRVKFSWVEPKGGAEHLFSSLVPRLRDAADAVSAALARWDTQGGHPALAVHGGFPLCTVPGYEHRYDDLRTHDYWTMSEIGEPDLFPVDDENKVKPAETCRGCPQRGGCPGLFAAYAERFGHEELEPPQRRPHANAFDYVFEKVSSTAFDPAEPCPVLTRGTRPFDRARHLFVRHGKKVGRYAAWTRDFDDHQIHVTKHELGQIYVDASKKAAPNDFAADLVKLDRSPICTGCEVQARCAGLFEPRFEDVFSRDDKAVRDVLGQLEGDVLDVGFGSMPYAPVLGEGVACGALRYVGIDPDAAAVDGGRVALPGADLRCGSWEQLRPGERFDHILILRSWNHLPDPVAAHAEILGRLRPGGSLVVVDNVGFALVRTPAQVRRAQASTAGWEHVRNDDAAGAHAVLDTDALCLQERVDVTPERSNQWMLRYTRTA